MTQPQPAPADDLTLREQFATQGYIGPFKLTDDIDLDALLQERHFPRWFLTWYKSFHEKSVPVIRAASAPEVTDKLQVVLGDNVLIWGSIFIGQKPEQAHNWHLDVEYGSWNGVTLWLGLKNLNSKTTLSLITHSHLLQTVPQELKDKFGIDTLDNDAILREAKKLDPRCELKTFTLKPGEFVIWSGRVWHTTLNKSDKTRFSLILQYSTPDNVARIPLNYDYPDTKWLEAQPPCVMVSGTDTFRCNKVRQKSDVEYMYSYMRPLYFLYYKFRQLPGLLKQKLVSA